METESKLFGVSFRGWLALLVTFTVCVMSLLLRDVKEPLYSLSIMALGFYFGQKTTPNGNGGPKDGST